MSFATSETERIRAFVDTNVLVYALMREMEHHAPSLELLERARNGELELCVTPQVMAEFFSIVTSPRRITHPRPPEEALDVIEQLLASCLALLHLPAGVVAGWVDLVRRCPVKGAGIFDYQLVAAMLAHGIKTIYTFNTTDFSRFTEIEARTP